MTHSTRLPALFLAAALAALPACTTKTIGPGDYRSSPTKTSSDQGGLAIVISPTPESLASPNSDGGYWIEDYTVFIDGRRLVNGRDYPPSHTTAYGAGTTGYGFIEAGLHHFALADESGGPFRFEADVVVLAGGVTRLYMFGPHDARRGMSVSYPMRPPPDSQHVVIANLVLDDTRLEVVSCDDATHCTPVSPAIASGETFEANLTLTGAGYSWGSLDASGAGIGVRQVATSTVPTPPVSGLSSDNWDASDAAPLPVGWSAAIMYMGEGGQVVRGSN